MLDSPSFFQLGLGLVVHLSWAAHTTAFVQDWQRCLQATEVAGVQYEEHMVEAASMVMGTAEQLDSRTAQFLTDLYQLSGQLPALSDRLLVGPLELRVGERQFLTSHLGGVEQAQVHYSLCVERYRYASITG